MAEPVAEKVHRAVEGLGDLIDGYEFHYPQELSHENISDVQAALGEHDIYCIAGGLHLDPRFGRGGLVNPDEHVRAEALQDRARGSRVRRLARREHDHLARDRGLQLPVPDALRAVVALADRGRRRGRRDLQTPRGQAVPRAQELRAGDEDPDAQHGDDACTSPNKLRAEGLDNVQINMDWQHLLMNDEHLPEYAALLHSEGLLGHQHGNSGWGTFDDDNMLGTTAFMETLELGARAAPLRLRRERRTARPRPLSLHRGPGRRGQALGDPVELHRLDRREDRRRGARARRRSRKDAVTAYELVYAALGA